MEEYFVKKEKWRIRFVPWKKSPTGIMVGMKKDEELSHDDISVTGLTMKEAQEFSLDCLEACAKRFDIEFPNDIKPKRTKEEFLEKVRKLIEKMEKRSKSPSYIR